MSWLGLVFRWCLLLCCLALAGVLSGHELRTAYLELREQGPGRFFVLWKVPTGSPAQEALWPGISGLELAPQAAELRLTADARVALWILEAPEVRGRILTVPGLDAAGTEVIAQAFHLDGSAWTQRLTAAQPEVRIPPRQSAWALAWVYVRLGVEHILFGVDHLLFVLGLLLLVDSRWMLLKTITALTVAHSLTLAVATFGWAEVPGAPLNAAIALSILFLGPEIVRKWRGQDSLTIGQPWLVAFGFGLLHGFGFASALTEAGLSRAQVPFALLAFNLGVELGQVAFVALVFLLLRSFRQLQIVWSPWVQRSPGYLIGVLGAYWTIQRTLLLF